MPTNQLIVMARNSRGDEFPIRVRLPFDEGARRLVEWQKDRELLAKARTLLHGEPKEFRKMLALAKTWDWDNACACCAVAATLLGA